MPVFEWRISNPGGGGTSLLSDLGFDKPQVDFRIMGVSKARLICHRDYDSVAGWWAADAQVTIYRVVDGVPAPYYTGRVQETPKNAGRDSETRTLFLADAWQDLEEVIYQEEWPIGGGAVLYPRCILGRDAAGELITTGEQIGEVIDYAISQGVSITKGTIDTGLQLWPSEARNMSCESVIVEQLRFHPDWACWLDHSTSPPTFHARVKGSLDTIAIDIADESIEGFGFAEVVRNVPNGVRIIYESAANIDGEVFRDAYLDTAGDTTGRKVMQAMLDLEGIQMQFQKSRIQTRTMPTNAASMKAYFKLKWPELADVPDAAFDFSNVSFTLVAEEDHPPAVCPKATRLTVESAADLPRELVSGSIEDWMQKKVGRVVVKYDLEIIGSPPADLKKILDNFKGTGKSFSVTATNAVTKRYKGISSFTEGEGRPEGLAAAIFAAATAQQHEGSVATVAEDVPAGRFHGKTLVLMNGETTIMPATVIHSAGFDIESGRMSLDFGPLPYLSSGDFLELQRLFRRRPATWMSQAERTSNELGAEAKPGSKGDTVSGYDQPQTVTPPGGGGSVDLPLAATLAATDPSNEISVLGGAYQVGAAGDWVVIPPTAAAVGDYAYLVVEQDENRDVTSVSVIISPTVLVPVVIDEAVPPDPETATSNILLGEVVSVGEGEEAVAEMLQRRHGNITLSLWQIGGDVVRWAETVVGEIPEPEPEPEP